MPKEVMIICGLSEQFPHQTKGTEVPCAKCERLVWISYSSLQSAKAKVPSITADQIKAMCIACGTKDMDERNLSPEPITEIQKKDLRNILGDEEDSDS